MKRILSVCALVALSTGMLAVPASAGDFDATVHLLKDASPGTQKSGVYEAVALGSRLIYTYESAANGIEVWTSDGTSAGTHILKDIAPGPDSSEPAELTLFGGKVYFRAEDLTHGSELWVTDGTPAGTKLYKDLRPGQPGSDSGDDQIVAVGGTLYFSARLASGPDAGEQVWKTDGVPAHTSVVQVIKASNDATNITGMTRWGNRLAFSALDDLGAEPWVTDGTTAVMIKDIDSGAGDSSPSSFTVLGTKLFFTATATGSPGNTQIWSSAPPVGNLVTAFQLSPSVNIFFPEMLVASGSTLWFRADSGSDGDELWKSDGTNAGTVLAANINPTTGIGSSIDDITAFGGSVYFEAEDAPGNGELWKANGTGVVKVKEINPGAGSFPGNFVADGAQLFFTAKRDDIGFELYATDGTTAGTQLVKDLAPGAFDSYANPLVTIGSTLFLSAQTTATGEELWAYTTKASTTTGYPKAKYSKKVARKRQIRVLVKVRASGTTPTGKVYLKQGATVVGIGVLTNGTASIRITKKWGRGVHKVQAYYPGSVYARSSSSALIHIKVK